MPTPNNPEMHGLLQKVEHQQSQPQFELTTNNLQADDKFLCVQAAPDMLCIGCYQICFGHQKNFSMLASDPFPVPLFVHPGLFSSRNTINGVPVLGLRTFGASHLIGYEIIFIEAPVPLGWLFERACNFVSIVRDRGSLIPHSETFGVDNSEVIRVRHRPASDDRPAGEIELTLERSSEFELEEKGLANSKALLVESEAEIALDQNDPIDRAILDRLKQAGQDMREVLEEETPEEFHVAGQPVIAQKSSFGQRGSKLFH